MNVLADLLELLLYPDIRPETPRGWLWVSLIYGTLVSCVLADTLADSPSASSTAIVLAFLGAPLGIVFSILHFVREPDDRRLATYTIIANAIAVVLAVGLWR